MRPTPAPRTIRSPRRPRDIARSALAALGALTALALAPGAAHAQRSRPVLPMQFAATTPPFMPTAVAVRAWLATHHTDAIAEDSARHAFHVYIAVLFPRAAGAGPFTLTWNIVEADGSLRAVAVENFTYDQPTLHVLARELPLPVTAGGFEAGHEYEVVLAAGGHDVARGRVRLTPAH